MYVRASFCVSNVGTIVSSSVIGVALGVEASCGVCAVAIGPTSVRQQNAKTLGHLITLTSISSQRKSRPLLLVGVGRDEGFDPVTVDGLIQGLRIFSPMKLKIIGKNVRNLRNLGTIQWLCKKRCTSSASFGPIGSFAAVWSTLALFRRLIE